MVNQSESRARIPMVNDGETILRIATLGEQLALLEKNEATIDNVLNFEYDEILNQLPRAFHLEHSRSASKTPYDEENDTLILRDEISDSEIRIYCPVALQNFTVSGYNVIKDCWLKFHSYRFTHCEFAREDLKDLLDLLNKISKQMQYVAEVDDLIHSIIESEDCIISYGE